MGKYCLAIIVSLLVICPAFSQEPALEYLEDISREYESVVRSQWQYSRALVEGASYEKEKIKLLETLNEAESRIGDIQPYRNDTALRDSVLAFLSLTRQMVREDYTRLADLQSLEDRSFSELDKFLFEQENAYKRLGRLAASLRKEEERYAIRYGIRLVRRDDRFARRLTELNQLFSYYNSVYLAFYKAYSQELVVFRTIEGRNADAIKSQLDILDRFSKEGIQQVKRAGGYKGDRRLYDAGLASLEFYRREATEELQTIGEYYANLEKLEKLSTERKEGVQNAEEYNELVKQINNATARLNEINEHLNRERARLLDQWNKVSGNFLAVQFP